MGEHSTPAERVSEYAAEHDLTTKAFPLARPFKVGGVAVLNLIAREPTAFDLEAGPQQSADTESLRWLVERMCGVADGELENMPYKNYAPIQEWVLDFLPDTQ